MKASVDEEGLGEEALEAAGPRHGQALLGRELLQAQHGDDVLQLPVAGMTA